MDNIKNIIFDLGGVLLNIDFKKSITAFEKLGVKNFEAMFSQFKADELFEKLETGAISEAEFYKAFKKRSHLNISNADIENAWNALILDFRIGSLAHLEKLSLRYKLYLLSNTNSIHVKCFKRKFTQQTGKANFDSFFKKAWYSNKVGLRKPNADIFKFTLSRENLEAAETLFIDDTLINIEAAAKLGFKTHHLLGQETIEQVII